MQSSADGKVPRVPVVLSHSNPGNSMYAQVDGACVGTAVGSEDGSEVGELEGMGVVGEVVGSALGSGLLGAGVGLVVGLGVVGAAVGSEDGSVRPSPDWQ